MDGFSSYIEFINLFFDERDIICIRPIETWVDDNDKKQSRVIYELIKYLRPAQVLQQWNMNLHYAEKDKANLFFGVCPRFGGDSKSTYDLAWQIRKVNCLWADVDECGPKDAVERCEQAGLPKPTCVVDSGHGAHLYWKLAEPFLIDDASDPPAVKKLWRVVNGKNQPIPYYEINSERFYLRHPETGRTIQENNPDLSPKGRLVQDIAAGIAAKIGGDHTQDLSRILRLPDTWNRKDERNGQKPVLAGVWTLVPSATCSIDDLAEFASESPDKQKRERIAQIPLPQKKKRQSQSSMSRLNDLIADCAVAEVGTRSETDYALLAYAIEEGMDPNEVWLLVQHVGKFVETERFHSGREYFDYTWDKASLTVRRKLFVEAEQRAKNRAESQWQDKQRKAAATEEATEPAAVDQVDSALLDALGLVVIGEHGNEIEVYSRNSRKYIRIREVDRLKYARLIQICGGSVVRRLVTEHDSRDKYTMSMVKNSIAAAAMRSEQLDDTSKRGAGCWPTPDGKIMLVGNRELAIWNGSLERSVEPIHDGAFYNMAGNPRWYDFKRLATILASGSQESDQAALKRVLELLRRWRWEFTQGPEIVVGLAMASWVQKLWTWRPQVFFSGGADSGKSVFFKMVKRMFCGLGQKASQNTTATGIIKRCRGYSYIAILDELDKNKNREEIYETVVRPAGRGDDERWTGIGKDGTVESALSQIFWFAGIDSGLNTKTDADRTIRLELLPREKGVAQLVQPTEAECWTAGEHLLAMSLRHAEAAPKLAVRLGATEIEGVSNRVTETYSVPAACYSSVAGVDADECLRDFLLNSFAVSEQVVDDEEDLFEAIRGSHVDAGAKLGRCSVEKLVRLAGEKHSHPGDADIARDALEKCGILVSWEDGKILLNTTRIARHLLSRTKFRAKSLGEIFRRMGFEEARTSKRRFWSAPMEFFYSV